MAAALKAPPAAAETVIEVDDDMDTADAADPPRRTIDELRQHISIATKAGRPDTDEEIVKWNAELLHLQAAKQAAKPLSQQLRLAEQSISKLEKGYAKLQADTAGYLDDLACAQKRLELHHAKIAATELDLEKARIRKAELARSSALAAPSGPSGAPHPPDLWQQLLTASLGPGVVEALEAVPGEFRVMLQALLGRAAAEAEANATAQAKALSAAEALASAATAASASAPAPIAAAAAAAAPVAAAPVTHVATSQHIRPPPTLQASCQWPDGKDGVESPPNLVPAPVTSGGGLSPEEFALFEALSTNTASDEQRASASALLASRKTHRVVPY